jgi:MSHA pilin protein MshA
MKKIQHGFTLIELVIVIVLVGILAAVAIPKFVDLKADAATAATKGVAGALAAASAINYADNLVKSTTLIASCTDADAGNLLNGGLPAGMKISGTYPTCVVTNDNGGTTATYTMSRTTP